MSWLGYGNYIQLCTDNGLRSALASRLVSTRSTGEKDGTKSRCTCLMFNISFAGGPSDWLESFVRDFVLGRHPPLGVVPRPVTPIGMFNSRSSPYQVTRVCWYYSADGLLSPSGRICTPNQSMYAARKQYRINFRASTPPSENIGQPVYRWHLPLRVITRRPVHASFDPAGLGNVKSSDHISELIAKHKDVDEMPSMFMDQGICIRQCRPLDSGY
jgi:hypothetical protein